MHSRAHSAKPLIEVLETRLLYSATIDVVLVDSTLADQDLLESAAADADHYFVFDSHQDSLAGIVEQVRQWSDSSGQQIDSLTLLSHGSQAGFQFGDSWVTTGSVAAKADLWEQLGDALADDANIYLYACDTGAGDTGQALLDALADATGADVFASDDATGAGGDWQLEAASNGDAAELLHGLAIPLNTALLKNYSGDLASTGEQGASATGDNYFGWSLPGNAYVEDGVAAFAFGIFAPTQDYYNFNLPVPAGSMIDGIEVRLNGTADPDALLPGVSFDIALSWDGGANWTAAMSSASYSSLLGLPQAVDETLGSSTYDWGHTWTTDDLSNANFRVKVSMHGWGLTDTLYTDYIGLNVYYSPNSAPNVTGGGLADQNLTEDFSAYTIDLNSLFNDAQTSDANLLYSVSGNSGVDVGIDANGIATISSALNWNGTEAITFTAQDEGGLTADTTANFIVAAQNDLPTTTGLATQNLAEDFPAYTIDLKALFDDVETADANLLYSVSGNSNIGVSIDANGVATISSALNWSGTEAITFAAQDEAGASVDAAADFVVSAVNDQPTTSGLADQALQEDFASYTIDLNTLFADVETSDANLVYSVSGNTGIGVSIDAAGIATISSTPNWNGSEAITFTAQDEGGLSVGATANFNVAAQNDTPTTTGLATQSVAEDFPAYTIDLKALFDDVETADANLLYSVSGNSNIGVSIDANGVATISSTLNWNGTEAITFTAQDEGGASVDAAADFVVNAVNDTPTTSGLADQALQEDFASYTIDLKTLFSDAETASANLVYSVAGNSNIGVSIDAAGFATISSTANWNGTEAITFTARDVEGAAVDATANFVVAPVNDTPTTTGLGDQNLQEDFASYSIDLNTLFSDVDSASGGLQFSVSGNSNIGISIDASGVATISSTPGWSGTESVSFAAADAEGASVATPVNFVVAAAPVPPVSGGPAITVFSVGDDPAPTIDPVVAVVDVVDVVSPPVSDPPVTTPVPRQVVDEGPVAPEPVHAADSVILAGIEVNIGAPGVEFHKDGDSHPDYAFTDTGDMPEAKAAPVPNREIPLDDLYASEDAGTPAIEDFLHGLIDAIPQIVALRDAVLVSPDDPTDGLDMARPAADLSWLKDRASQYVARPGDVLPQMQADEIARPEDWFWQQLDRMDDDVRRHQDSQDAIVQGLKGVGSVSASLFAGWLVRAAVFSSSMFATIPAWRNMDLIAVLDQKAGRKRKKDTAEDEHHVEDMFS